MTTVLSIENLSFSYEPNSEVLTNISFSVKAGESIAVIGANGAGKSTLLLHTNGSHPCQRGRVVIDGVPVEHKNIAHARKHVGLVFQDPDDQLFMPTVEQDVAFGPKNMGLSSEEIESRVLQALNAVDALSLRKRMPHKLSGGEKRRIALAAVLAMHPRLLVFDEPSAHLDPRARRRFIQLLKTLPQAKIIATHDLDMALELCERTIVLHNGAIAFDGKTAAAFESSVDLEHWNLEKPLGMQHCPKCAAVENQ
jgi:cobalt/nickel transport system ATP-binding protein